VISVGIGEMKTLEGSLDSANIKKEKSIKIGDIKERRNRARNNKTVRKW
jgi:hypothetical protein